ncbi:MAG: fimbrial assembly protein FimA [Euryarchaeota archaeon RBG_19FT_COMBO_69_17]|nr:MAG: fimbrial assembly protein FimA [Euryarchaeota archaeon RBG_19FT_COMBO_69_17]
MSDPRPSTFSIVAYDPKTKDLGVAVESRFVAVGAVVPWAQAGVGAMAIQSYANTAYGPRGLALLRKGLHPKDVLKTLLARDPTAAQRQVGVVDARGRAAAYTGDECFEWAGHLVGRNYAAQGNILASEGVLKGMARAFESTDGDLPVRLLAALAAGQEAGGDRRGQESASLLVVRKGGGYGGFNDRWVDLRVDDHPAPIEELVRIFNVYDATLLDREDPADTVPLRKEAVKEVQEALQALGFHKGPASGKWDARTRKAFEDWAGMNNFENKVRKDDRLWGSLYRILRSQAGRQ